MAAPEYEVQIPGTNDGGHSEAEWRKEDIMVNLKLFINRYECLWYTNASREKFIECVFGYPDAVTGGQPSAQISKAVTVDSQVLDQDDFNEELRSYDISDFEYIEARIDDVTAYWKDELPPREELRDLHHLIHVSGHRFSSLPLEYLFIQLTPEIEEKHRREELIRDVIEYIDQSQNLEDHDGSNSNT